MTTKQKETVVDVKVSDLSLPSLNLDDILKAVTSAPTRAGGSGGGVSGIAAKIMGQLVPLVAAAAKAGISQLPFRPTVKQIAIALGVPADKRTQYYFQLSEQVREKVSDKIALIRDGRNVIIQCIPAEVPAGVVNEAPSVEEVTLPGGMTLPKAQTA
jgi:hypothetical protein